MSSNKLKERKNLERMAQETSVNRRRTSLPTRKDSAGEESFDENNQSENGNDDEGESYSGSSSSSEVRSKSDATVVGTFKPIVSQRRYIPDLDSLPKGGVWISPAPPKHTEFKQVVVRTTKCDICNQKVEAQDKDTDGKVMQRCCCCNIQFCQDCVLKVSDDEIHFPVLAELEWEAKTKVNAITRPLNGFKSHMFHKPRSEPKPVRPMTASERLASSRTITAGKFSNMAINTPTPSRPSRGKPSKAAAKKSKKRELPPGCTAEEVDIHYEVDWNWIKQLPVADQRKEKKEAAQRNLMRKRTLEAMEDGEADEAGVEESSQKVRTPLPNAPKRRKVATRTPATRRGKEKFTKNVVVTSDSETLRIQPPLNTLDSLSQARKAIRENRQGMSERSDDNERGTTPSHDDYDNEDCIRVEANEADEDEYEPEDD
ncbi:hypothetical protein ACHAO1_001695 [Botrytis cinerea]